MALYVLTAGAGAPGATTTAVGLTLNWSRSVLLVDADPSAAQAVLAGRLRGSSSRGKGLVRVAEAHRERRSLLDAAFDQSVELSSAGETRRLLLPGFQRPANGLLFANVWSEFAPVLQNLDQLEIDVVVDAGRIDPRGLPQPLIDHAAGVFVVTRTSLRAVAAARAAWSVLNEQVHASGGSVRAGLVLVGHGKPYGSKEISAALHAPVLAELADDPTSAAVYSDGAEPDRRLARSPLVRSLDQLMQECHRLGARAADQVGAFA